MKDKKRFFRSIFEAGQKVVNPPKPDEIRQFWEGKIWGDATKYKDRPCWQDKVEKTCRNVKQQEWVPFNKSDISNQLSKAMNWKAPEYDCIPNF